MNLIPLITAAGLNAVFNATNDGLSARITHVALGDSAWSPTNAATELQNERNRVAISNGNRVDSNQIHITAIENGEVEYWVREIGFILDDGTLFAVWSDPNQALAFKAAEVDLLLAFDFVLSALPEDSVEVVGTGGVNLSPATDTVIGVMRFATDAEALAALIDNAAITPEQVRAHGDSRYSQVGHSHTWNSITGRPSTFPPSNHSHTWNSITGRPSTFPPSSHSHTWNSITGRPSTFPPSNHSHDWDSITDKPLVFRPNTHTHSWSQVFGRPSTFPPSIHNHPWTAITGKPTTFPPSTHNHDGRYLSLNNLLITDGFVRTNARREDREGHNDFNSNWADIRPPNGFTMAHLRGFVSSIAIIYFDGNVDANDSIWCRWEQRADRVRVICASSENRPDASGAGSYINYFALWIR